MVTGAALSLLAVILGVGGSWFIARVAERMSDRMLAASVRSIIDTIAVEHNEVTLEMPPAAFGMLEDSSRDNVYYSVYQGRRFLTGYANFPAETDVAGIGDDDFRFRYDRFLDQPVRVVTAVRHFPQVHDPIVVQVAETLDERGVLTRTMLIGLGLLEASLVGFAIFLIWPAIRWGLRPVTRVQGQIAARDPDKIDFTPLRATGVTPELSGLIAAFNQLLTQLGAATERSRRFTADASHQMRTPLAVLRAHIELLQKDRDQSARQQATIADIGEATDRLQRLLTQLLALARAEQEAEEATAQSCDAARVVQEVCMRLAPQAADAGLELHFEANGTFDVRLPSMLLEELVANLVDNAIRYASSGTYIMVRVDGAGSEPAIEVMDDGPGIPDEFLAMVSERFYRLPRDQKIAGSGLGLSIAAAISERAGGRLSLMSRKDGSPFVIRVSFNRQL
ncbi:MAG: sensor histidine kinase N-terminal domain-containing protein [Sphingobium sp.]|nr:sensor histidine kinase N-terminal domain-containing protein [Sphingobium sp.]